MMTGPGASVSSYSGPQSGYSGANNLIHLFESPYIDEIPSSCELTKSNPDSQVIISVLLKLVQDHNTKLMKG